MRRCLTALIVVGLVSVSSRDAAAQPSSQDYAAYGALLGTPVGAFTPILAAPGTKGENGFNVVAGRFGMHSPKTGESDNSLGASAFYRAGQNATISGTLGYTMVGCPTGATCDNGLMLGADVHSSLWNSAGNTPTSMSVNLQGSLGYGKYGDVGALSMAVGFPLAMTMEQASKARFSAYFSPGFGWGRLAVDAGGATVSESGTRPMFSLGGAWMAPGGWGLHAAFQRVVIEDGGNNFGLGFTWAMR